MGFGFEGVAIIGVGRYTLGLDERKGFEGDSARADAMGVEGASTSAGVGVATTGLLVNLGFDDSAGTCGGALDGGGGTLLLVGCAAGGLV